MKVAQASPHLAFQQLPETPKPKLRVVADEAPVSSAYVKPTPTSSMSDEAFRAGVAAAKARAEGVFVGATAPAPTEEQRRRAIELETSNPTRGIEPITYPAGPALRSAKSVTAAENAKQKTPDPTIIKAAKEVATARPLVAESLRRHASPEQQQQFAQVERLVARDPVATLSLQQLALDGKLFAPNRDGQTIIGAIAAKAESIDPVFPKEKLVSELVREVHQPDVISQGHKATCVFTCAQTLLARNDPAEYARVTMGLASREGKVTMRGGEELAREPSADAVDLSFRTVPSRIVQAALMEHGNGASVDYDNRTDGHSDGRWGGTPTQLSHALTQLTGDAWETVKGKTPDPLESFVGTTPAQPKFVGLDWGMMHHMVEVRDVASVSDPWVTLHNPTGANERLVREAFERRLHPDSGDGLRHFWVVQRVE